SSGFRLGPPPPPLPPPRLPLPDFDRRARKRCQIWSRSGGPPPLLLLPPPHGSWPLPGSFQAMINVLDADETAILSEIRAGCHYARPCSAWRAHPQVIQMQADAVRNAGQVLL